MTGWQRHASYPARACGRRRSRRERAPGGEDGSGRRETSLTSLEVEGENEASFITSGRLG